MKTLILSLLFQLALPLAPLPAAAAEKAPPQLEFPTPPEPTRIKWVRTIKTVDDLKGRKRSLLSGLADSFLGSDSTSGLFDRPYSIWVDAKGRVVMADGAQGVVHIMDLESRKDRKFTGDGPGALKSPVAAATDPAGNLYVSDGGDNSVKAFGPDLKFRWKFERWEGDGSFGRTSALAWSPKGEVLVVDAGRRSVVAISPEGKFLREFLRGGKDDAALGMTANLWVDKEGVIYESDPVAGRIHLFSADGKIVFGFGENGDRPGYMARPRGVATDSDGNIYVVDAVFNRVQIFDRQGRLLLYWAAPGSRDGELNLPAGLFIDAKDTIYLVDAGNARLQVFQYIKVPPTAYKE